MMNISLVLFLAASVVAIQATSCRNTDQSKGDLIEFGPQKFTSLVIFFEIAVTREQIEKFHYSVLSKSRSDGRGRDLPNGVALLYQLKNGNYEGVGITFSVDAKPEERERLKESIKASPIVFRVYENVVPIEITDLPENTKTEPTRTPEMKSSGEKENVRVQETLQSDYKYWLTV